MNDCFEFMEEPLYGFRVTVTQEIECSKLGSNCGMPSNTTVKGGLILESFSICLLSQKRGTIYTLSHMYTQFCLFVM